MLAAWRPPPGSHDRASRGERDPSPPPPKVKRGRATVDVPRVNPPARGSCLPERRLGRVRAVAMLAGSLALTLGLGAVSASAQADTISQANAQAQKLAAQIEKLQPKADAALAAYDTSLAALGEAVSTNVAAERTYSSLLQQADDLVTEQDSHIVALYESGGSLALYVSALRSGDSSGLVQLPYLKAIVTTDAEQSAAATRLAVAAKATLDATQTQIDSGLANTDSVNVRLAAVQSVLAQQEGLLDEASGRAKKLQALKDAAAALAASQAAADQAGAQAAQDAQPYPMPLLYRALYQNAAQTCPGLPWTILAAIGQVETHHGSGGMVSSAGALGPMQFLPGTFLEYARDGDHDGRANIMDPADAIYSAAAYLCANGAGQGGQSLYTAIWNYNHADWYVQLVLALSAKIT
jgi:Transglycosylase SLT domain